MLTFAIGDIHGCDEKLGMLLTACRDFSSRRPSRYVFVGDYLDRGANSRAVIERVLELQRQGPSVIALMGNHEEMLLNALHSGDALEQWRSNGGGETLRSYGVDATSDLPAQHVNWLGSLPDRFDDGRRLFVHAGIRPGVSIDAQTHHDLLWIREPFLSSTAGHERFIVHGHTPLNSNFPDVHSNRVNLDTGAVYGGALCAAIFED
ncbi:MAG: metallophosphoesterase family protein, partial [Hyphomicrobiales bacterium]